MVMHKTFLYVKIMRPKTLIVKILTVQENHEIEINF